jgi:hypothetical protein
MTGMVEDWLPYQDGVVIEYEEASAPVLGRRWICAAGGRIWVSEGKAMLRQDMPLVGWREVTTR